MSSTWSEVLLVLPYPISANRYWKTAARGHRAVTYVSKEAEQYKAAVRACAFERGISKPLPIGRVHVDIALYPHRPQDWLKRARLNPETWDDSVQCIDLDNARKVLYDSLKGTVLADDSRKIIRRDSGEIMVPDGEARVVVTIRPLKIERAQTQLLAG